MSTLITRLRRACGITVLKQVDECVWRSEHGPERITLCEWSYSENDLHTRFDLRYGTGPEVRGITFDGASIREAVQFIANAYNWHVEFDDGHE